MIFILIRIPAVQNYLVQQITSYLEKKIETPVHIGFVSLDLPKLLVLEDVYFEDQSADTLLSGEQLKVDINLFRLLNNVVEINRVDLVGITAKINRTLPDSTFNFDYIIDAFVDPNKPQDTTAAMQIDIDRVNLERIHLVYHDEVIGLSTDLDLGIFHTRIRKFDLSGNMHFAFGEIQLNGFHGRLRQWLTPSSTEGNATTDITETAETELLPKLEFDKFDISNVDFSYLNSEMGLDSRFVIRELLSEINELDLNESLVNLDYLELNGSDSHVFFEKLATANIESQIEAKPDTASNAGWKVTAGRIQIQDTDFAYRDDNQERIPKGFDYGNIGISNLNGSLEQFSYSTDSIAGQLTGLSAQDHSGFQINRLESKFSYTDQGAELDGLYAETPNTVIRDYIRVEYPSLSTLTDRLGEIQINADLRQSHLGMQDVLFFVPDMDTVQIMEPLWPQTFYVDGQIRGRLDQLSIPELTISTLENTRIQASAELTGLPDIENFKIQLQLTELNSSRSDLDQLIAKGLLPDSIQLPSQIHLSGTFDGGLRGFDTDLSLLTSEGNMELAANYQITDQNGITDTLYDAQVAIMDFQLGKILSMDSTLGKLSFSAEAKGRSLDPKKAVASLKAELIHLEAMGYPYKNITLQASAEAGEIQATAESLDPNIDFDLQATAEMSAQYPKVNMTLMIDSINLKNLQLMEEEFRYHGKVVADLETADIDYINGSVEIQNSSIAYNQERYTFDSVKLLAAATDSTTLLQLTSEFLQAHLVGHYKLSELNPAIQDIIAVYYQPDSIASVYEYSPQQFDFSAKLIRSRFIRDFLPELTEMQDITLDGSFNSEDKFLLAKASAPKINYSGTEIEDVSFDVTTFDSTMYYSALIKRMAVSNIELINTLLSGTVLQNQLDFGLWIKDNEDVERYHLGMGLQVESGNFLFSLLEDGLMLNYDRWEVDPENSLSFGKDGIRANQFILTQNGQQMQIQSQDSTLNSPIDLLFENFRIETFSQMLESDLLNMGGGINGGATISRLESDNPLFVSDIQIERFFFGKDTVGDILISVDNERENILAADIRIEGNGNQVSLTGDFITPPNQAPSLDFILQLEPLTMKTLEAFSLGYIRQAEGNLSGQLAITGSTSQPRIKGEVLFDKAALNVGMLNATFQVDQQRIVFDDRGIRFNRFELLDDKNNLARMNGTINTTTFTDFNFNLSLTAEDFQVLNSTRVDNDLFYGQMFISSNLKITGDLNNPVVNGNINVGENTNVTFILPNDDPGLVEREGIIQFVDRSDTSQVNVFARLDSLTTTELGGLNLSLNIQTHEDAEFTIVLDEGSEDALHIQGNAILTAGIDPTGNITLTGTYTVEEGSYSFTFEPVKRVFNFKKGSTITWAGDPMDARLNITAVYKIKAPSLELVQTQIGGDQSNIYRQRLPFDVNLGITGEMMQPQLQFSIDLDEDNSLISQDVATKVNTALIQLQENESEMNKQVFALIVLGRFMASNPFESMSGGGVESMARNSVSSLLSTQLNRLAGDLIRGVELDFDLQSGQDFTTGTMQNRTDLNIGVSKMMFDDRLKVTIGSNFELEGNARPGEQTTNIAGDIAVDYVLSKDGRYLLRAYRKNQYQVTLQGQFVEHGVGFIFNTDYDKFKELFMSSNELADLYNTDSRDFQRRFDRERMETDSVYRDSVRQVIRDSMQRANPEFEERMRLRRIRQQNQDSTLSNERIDRTDGMNRTNSSNRTDRTDSQPARSTFYPTERISRRDLVLEMERRENHV